MLKKFILALLLAITTMAAQPIVVKTTTLFDGKGRVLKNKEIVIEGGRIARVSDAKGRPTYDLSGLTVIPGWIDTHVHLGWHFNKEGRLESAGRDSKESAEQATLHAAGNAYATLLGGFTTVQGLGAAIDGDLRDLINAGVLPGPRVLTSLRSVNENTGDPEQIRAYVRKMKADGADVIKLFATKSIREGGAQSMTDEQIRAACGEAKLLGLRSVVHAHAPEGAKAAVLAGCTSIEHGAFLDDATLQLMAERGVFFDPNFLVLHNYLDNKPKFLGIGNYTEEGFAHMVKALPLMSDVLKRAMAYRVKIVLGTDAVAGAHGRNAEEFIYRVKDGGQPAVDAIVSGTSLAAESLGLQDRVGSIGDGMEADLVAVAGNPLEDITTVRRVVFVMKGGKIYKNALQKPVIQEWPVYGGDQAGTKYSPLDQIDRENVRRLRVAWTWKTGEGPREEFKTVPGMFEATPLMIGGTLYLSTPYNRVVALDADTGRERWSYDPKAYEDGQPPNGTGFVHRGVAVWRDNTSKRLRIFMNSRYRLIALDGETGRPVPSFGDNGVVNLARGLLWEINPKHYTNTSPPLVYKDLVILGNGVADRLVYKNDPPGDVRAFDARTGKLVWTFHTVPQGGEYGNDTWEQGSERYTGHTNVWAPMSLDEERGLLYLPVSTPSNDFYGGRRPGENLFADSIVCLDAATGRRKWHHQLVHHGLWDYDTPAPPNLVTIHVNGSKIAAVAQLTKMGFLFVFDRVTGKPVWPIQERPVPASDVPGERAWPTQPYPTHPPPISPQGVSLDDAFDLTPELKAEAQANLKELRLGPLFTPPSFQGTLMRPGIIGGANWGGGAFDPETGMLYVKTTDLPSIARLKQPDAHASDVDADYVLDRQRIETFHDGLPLLKPPYGHLTAIKLNTGEIAWQAPFGDDARLRAHPALRGAKLPDRLGAPGAAGAIVTKGGLIFAGGGDSAFHAVDKRTGEDLWTYPLPNRTTATPMTYRTETRQYVVIATGSGTDATLVAFALPDYD